MAPTPLAPEIYYPAAVLIGLVVGSFVNVVIVRLPMMLEAEWRRAAAEILQQPAPETRRTPTLVTPRSFCPRCHTSVRARDNVPVLGFLLLGGRCRACREPISWRYPAIELTAAVIAVVAVARFGASPLAVSASALGWTLLAAAIIDARTHLLLDPITLSILWAGLLASLGYAQGWAQVDVTDAVTGAAAGYLALWLVCHMFRLATGKQGMGYGDFKLAAALGAWVGWQLLALTVFLAALFGLAASAVLLATGRPSAARTLAFGPWLALAGWLTLLSGPTLVSAYTALAGLQ